MSAATTALSDAVSTTGPTPAPGNACTRYGPAFPTVSAPTTVPTASPHRARNQVAAIFIAGGYTPARKKPAANRETSAGPNPDAMASQALPAAPNRADAANRRLAGTMSARLSTADTAVPATNPI